MSFDYYPIIHDEIPHRLTSDQEIEEIARSILMHGRVKKIKAQLSEVPTDHRRVLAVDLTHSDNPIFKLIKPTQN